MLHWLVLVCHTGQYASSVQVCRHTETVHTLIPIDLITLIGVLELSQQQLPE